MTGPLARDAQRVTNYFFAVNPQATLVHLVAESGRRPARIAPRFGQTQKSVDPSSIYGFIARWIAGRG